MGKLTDTQITKKLKPGTAPTKHADGGGLTLTVNPNGSKLWSVRYRLGGKPSAVSAGRYPEVGLAEARRLAIEVRAQVLAGKDPAAARKADRGAAAEAAANTFRAVAEDWMREHKRKVLAKTAHDTKLQLERHVFPHIGSTPIGEITVRSMALQQGSWFRRLVEDSPTMAARAQQHMTMIFEHAVATGLSDEGRDPARYLKRFIGNRTAIPRPAARTIEDARLVLAALEAQGTPSVLLMNRWLVLTCVRHNEARLTRWDEISGLDTDSPLWTIPAERMKGHKGKRREHVVPLSPAAVEVLRAVRRHPLSGAGALVFPGRCYKTISKQPLADLYGDADLPVPHVPHGWRATFSTLMNERFPADRAQIDLMLAHLPGGRGLAVSAAETAYNRATFLPRRRELASLWADMILRDAGSAFALIGIEAPMRLVA